MSEAEQRQTERLGWVKGGSGVRRRRGERGEGARAAAHRGDGETAQGGARTPTASMSAAHRECVCAASATRPRRARVHLALCAVLASLLPGVAGAIDCANYQDAVGATFKHTAARLAPCEGKTQQEPCRCVQAWRVLHDEPWRPRMRAPRA